MTSDGEKTVVAPVKVADIDDIAERISSRLMAPKSESPPGGFEVFFSSVSPKHVHTRELIRQVLAEEFGARTQIMGLPGDDPLLERTLRHTIERVPEIVHARRQELTEGNIDRLVELYLTDDPIAEARTALEADNARERARLLTEVTCLNSRQVAEFAGHQATNTSMTASRWKQQRRVFSIPWNGNELYPAFQFRDGQPHPHVANVLRELPTRLSPWQVAFWFTSSNGWLRGAAPADRLDDESAVVAAARRENESIVG